MASKYTRFCLSTDLGEGLCDMHDGFQDFIEHTDGFRLISHIRFDNYESGAAIENLLEGISRGKVAHNKILYLMGEVQGGFVAMYSWDSRYLGIVTFSIDN